MKRVYFHTLGCKVNQYDTESLAELFTKAGYGIADTPAGADVVVVNSCTVTAEADRKTRQAVRRFRRIAPDSVIVLCGCVPQAYPAVAAALPEADVVTGNKDHRLILDLVDRALSSRSCVVDIPSHAKGDDFEDFRLSAFSGRTRAIVKIQDGCDRYCSYCIIPTSRGRSRSRSLESLSAELDNFKAQGFREVVLVGINFCCYGLDIGKTFVDAIELACGKGFDRVRIGSLEYDNISDEAIARLAALRNFCPQFHISLQSGCDRTLKAMNRHYNSADYLALCESLRAAFPDAAITTDLMVGFPGETDEDFADSLAFAEKVGFEKIHVFPYSARPGTRAAEMEQVPASVKEARTDAALKLSDELRQKFFESCLGRTVSVLCETEKEGAAFGYTENYTPVKVQNCTGHSGEIVSVKVTGSEHDNLIGELCSAG